MSKQAIFDLFEMLDNDLQATYYELERGKNCKQYMIQSLNAYYEFIDYINKSGLLEKYLEMDLDYIKEMHKQKYSLVFEEEKEA